MRDTVVTVKDTEGRHTGVTVTPTEVRIKISQHDLPKRSQIVKEIPTLVDRIPTTVPRTLRGDYRYDDGLLHLVSGGGSYGYRFYDFELQSVKYKGDFIYGTKREED